jgi:hypothetical protein
LNLAGASQKKKKKETKPTAWNERALTQQTKSPVRIHQKIKIKIQATTWNVVGHIGYVRCESKKREVVGRRRLTCAATASSLAAAGGARPPAESARENTKYQKKKEGFREEQASVTNERKKKEDLRKNKHR